jgi:hypothetical protein
MAIYFLQGSLPWQGLGIPSREEKYARVLELKQKITVYDLCEGLPREFAMYMEYLRQMDDPDQPDYRYLRSLFEAERLGFKTDNEYDWTIREFNRLSACPSLTSGPGKEDSIRDRPQRGKAKPRSRKKRRQRIAPRKR